MIKLLVFALLGLVVIASAQPLLTPEAHFLGIPNADSLTTTWYHTLTNNAYGGQGHPVDLTVLKLSDYDYRVVILDAFPDLFSTFR